MHTHMHTARLLSLLSTVYEISSYLTASIAIFKSKYILFAVCFAFIFHFIIQLTFNHNFNLVSLAQFPSFSCLVQHFQDLSIFTRYFFCNCKFFSILLFSQTQRENVHLFNHSNCRSLIDHEQSMVASVKYKFSTRVTSYFKDGSRLKQFNILFL